MVESDHCTVFVTHRNEGRPYYTLVAGAPFIAVVDVNASDAFTIGMLSGSMRTMLVNSINWNDITSQSEPLMKKDEH